MAKKGTAVVGGRHTTLIPAAKLVFNALRTCEGVRKVSPGFIKAGLPPLRGLKHIKVTSERNREGTSLKVNVRDNLSIQTLRVYGKGPIVEVFLQQYAADHNMDCTIA